MDVIRLILVALHLLGMAAIVGSFFVQLRRRNDYALGVMVAGAITQLITGLAMVGIAEMTDAGVDYAKIGTKLVIAVIVAIAAVLAVSAKRRRRRVQTWFHVAGGLAVVNVLVAVFWGFFA